MLNATSAKMQIFCLPHAGGSTAHFLRWHWLAPYARVVPMELPGHGTLLREPLISDWRVLVDHLATTLIRQIQGPYVVFGHSMGSLLAFDLCRVLENRGHPPALLVAAGRNGPSHANSRQPLHALPEEEFIAALRELGGFPDALLQHAALLELFLPSLRNDLRLVEQYTRQPGPPLSVPILTFQGKHDNMTDDVGMLAWTRETTGGCELIRIEEGHFFLDHSEFTEPFAARIASLNDPRAKTQASA